MINVYLDDWRIAPEGWVQAWSVEQLNYLFKNNDVNMLSLDNDLGLNEDGTKALDGLDFIKLYFVPNKYNCNKIMVHSSNFIARKHIFSYLNSAKNLGVINANLEIDEEHYPVSTKNKG